MRTLRAHIMSTSSEIGALLRAGLETEGDLHHITVDADVSTAERPIPLDADLLVADLDHPCMPPGRMLRRLRAHPATQHAHVVLISSKCATAQRLLRDHQWATVIHSLRDLVQLHDLWLDLMEEEGPDEG